MNIPFLVLISCTPHVFEFTCESGAFYVVPTARTHGRVRFDEQNVPYVSEPRIAGDLVDTPARYMFDLNGHEATLWVSSREILKPGREAALISSQKGKAIELCGHRVSVY